jgi:hypothetical protein
MDADVVIVTPPSLTASCTPLGDVVRAAGGAQDQEVLHLGQEVLGEHVAAGVVMHLVGAAKNALSLRGGGEADRRERIMSHDVTCFGFQTARPGRMWMGFKGR